jgi:hypothetical protein
MLEIMLRPPYRLIYIASHKIVKVVHKGVSVGVVDGVTSNVRGGRCCLPVKRDLLRAMPLVKRVPFCTA